MNRLRQILGDPYVMSIVRYVFLFLFGVAIFFTILFTQPRNLIAGCNACFIPGVILLVLGFFSLVNRYGGFDFFAYGFSAATHSLRRGSPLPYDDLVDYKDKKKGQREMKGRVYLPYFIYGGLWLIPATILFILFKVSA